MKLIDPKMSIDTIKSYIEVWDCKGCLPYGETQHNVMAVDDLQYLPTIEAEPVWHGRWIPCSERMPEVGIPVLIYDKHYKSFFVAKLDVDYFGFTSNIWHHPADVPFWIPLPEPPKE